MTDEEKRQIIMSAKYSRIIQQLSEMYGVSLKDATDMFSPGGRRYFSSWLPAERVRHSAPV